MSVALSVGTSIHLVAVDTLTAFTLVNLVLDFLNLEFQVDRGVFDPFQGRVEIGQRHLHVVDLLGFRRVTLVEIEICSFRMGLVGFCHLFIDLN